VLEYQQVRETSTSIPALVLTNVNVSVGCQCSVTSIISAVGLSAMAISDRLCWSTSRT